MEHSDPAVGLSGLLARAAGPNDRECIHGKEARQMNRYHPVHFKRFTPAWVAGLLWLLTAAAAGAVEISGQVTVHNKEGQPLARFDQAVVFIEGIETLPPAEPAVLDQRNKEFVPRLLPVVKGQEVRFLNSDPIQHNVFSPHEQEPFDLGLYPAGESKSVRLNALKRHKVYCNLHKNMVADIFVLPNRYFSLTDETGRYRIQGVPEGEFVLRVWHIFGGADQKIIRVGNRPLVYDFTLRSAQSIQEIIEHPNKTGQGYSSTASESY
jgi:plastocyanin